MFSSKGVPGKLWTAATTMQVPAKICKEPLKALTAENEEVIILLEGRIEKDILLPDCDTVNFIVE